jgi:hypothetical protein
MQCVFICVFLTWYQEIVNSSPLIDKNARIDTHPFIFFFLLSFPVSSQCAGSEVKPLTEDRGCDSVLLGQSNRTPHGAVIDEYGAMVD